MKIKVRRIKEEDIPKLIKFNRRMYRNRDKIEDSISFRILKNPFSKQIFSYISYLEDNSIIGQIFLMPTQFKFSGEIKNANWGMDYIVDDEYRGSIAGVQLCKKALKENLHFGIGLSEVSLKIHLIFNEKIISKMTKFIKINNFLSLFQIITKRTKHIQYTFPEKINAGRTVFQKVKKAEEIISDNGYWNSDEILEFSRNNDFLKWRFFYYKEKYTVYKMQFNNENAKSVYFVIRPIVWKGLNGFLIVDYRNNSTNDFDSILKAVNKLSRLNNSAVTITGSTLESLNKILKKRWYFPFGQKREIVTNFKNIFSDYKINSNKVLVTFADSDCDFYYGDNKW
tara:strand:- start:151 stop:1170 length:1020 start_codon:yes stop_codon:yes gene_type:complete